MPGRSSLFFLGKLENSQDIKWHWLLYSIAALLTWFWEGAWIFHPGMFSFTCRYCNQNCRQLVSMFFLKQCMIAVFCFKLVFCDCKTGHLKYKSRSSRLQNYISEEKCFQTSLFVFQSQQMSCQISHYVWQRSLKSRDWGEKVNTKKTEGVQL